MSNTYCCECKHRVRRETDTGHMYLCRVTKEVRENFVSGPETYLKRCGEVNDGQCAKFEQHERPSIIEAAKQAAAIVKTWPIWKQNLLVNSLKPTTTPREPVHLDNKDKVLSALKWVGDVSLAGLWEAVDGRYEMTTTEFRDALWALIGTGKVELTEDLLIRAVA